MLLAKTRVSADLAEWSDRLLPEEINNFSGINPGPTTNIDKLTRKKEKSNSFHLLFPEKMCTDIAKRKQSICVEMHVTVRNVVSKLRNVFILNRVLSEPKTGCEQYQVNVCTHCFKSYNILNKFSWFIFNKIK